MFVIIQIHIHIQVQMASYGRPKALVEANVTAKFYFCWKQCGGETVINRWPSRNAQTIMIQFNAEPKRIALQKRA